LILPLILLRKTFADAGLAKIEKPTIVALYNIVPASPQPKREPTIVEKTQKARPGSHLNQ
jgi:hypothetical protein